MRHGVLSVLCLDAERLIAATDIEKLGGKDVLPVALSADRCIRETWEAIVASGVANKVDAVASFCNFRAAVAAHLMNKTTTWLSGKLTTHELGDADLQMGHWLFWCVDEIKLIPSRSRRFSSRPQRLRARRAILVSGMARMQQLIS